MSSEMVKKADVARFLGVDAADVDAFTESGLPFVKVPGPKRPGKRIFLPDLHAWLAKRTTSGSALMNYETFRRAFFDAQKKDDAEPPAPED